MHNLRDFAILLYLETAYEMQMDISGCGLERRRSGIAVAARRRKRYRAMWNGEANGEYQLKMNKNL